MADFKLDQTQLQAAIDQYLKETKVELPEGFGSKLTEVIASKMKNGVILGAKQIEDQFKKIDLSEAGSKALNNLENSFKGKLGDISNDIKVFAKEIGLSSESLKEYGLDVAKFAVTWGSLNTLGVADFSKFTSGIDDVGSSVDALNKIGTSGELGKKIQEALSFGGMDKFLAAQDAALNLEQSFFKLKSETGSLNEYLNAVNSGATNATNFTAQFNEVNNTITNTAKSTGRAYDQVAELSQILGEGMPRATEEFNNVNISATESIGDMEAAIKIGAATGQKAANVAEYMRDNYQEFGNSAEKAGESSTRAATNFAKMALVANQVDISFSKMERIVKSVGDAFLYYGDNTESLVNMIGKLGPAFQAAKLSPEAITQLSSTMAKNLTQMGLAQRAFLSLQTGGAGGLRGSYQVEMLKAQNKFEEIQAMADKALKKQFGGRVVTMEEASKDEGAARQFTKQVQLLTQGPLKMVDNEAQAKALIDAMAKGDTSGANRIISGQDALKNTIDQGNKQTEKQTNVLNDIAVEMKSLTAKATISAAADALSLQKSMREKAQSGDVKKILDQFGLSEIFSAEEASKQAAQSKVGTLSARTPEEELLDKLSGRNLKQAQKEQAEKSKAETPNVEQGLGTGLIAEGFSAIGNLFSAAPEIPSAPPPPENPILSTMMGAAKAAGLGGAASTGPQPTQEVNVNIRDSAGEVIAQVGMFIEGKVKEIFERGKQSENQQKAIGVSSN